MTSIVSRSGSFYYRMSGKHSRTRSSIFSNRALSASNSSRDTGFGVASMITVLLMISSVFTLLLPVWNFHGLPRQLMEAIRQILNTAIRYE